MGQWVPLYSERRATGRFRAVGDAPFLKADGVFIPVVWDSLTVSTVPDRAIEGGKIQLGSGFQRSWSLWVTWWSSSETEGEEAGAP